MSPYLNPNLNIITFPLTLSNLANFPKITLGGSPGFQHLQTKTLFGLYLTALNQGRYFYH
jgi:hypothetical protein